MKIFAVTDLNYELAWYEKLPRILLAAKMHNIANVY